MSKRYIVLITKPGDDRLYGPVELSFSLDVAENKSFQYWDVPGSKEDALGWANRDIEMWRKSNPAWQFAIWDVEDPLIPVHVDWDKWKAACAPHANTIRGVTDKYHAHNLCFYKKNAHELAAVHSQLGS